MTMASFLEVLKKDGVNLVNQFTGRFNVRISTKRHEKVTAASLASGKRLNQWVTEVIYQEVNM